jgi:MFS family permease
MKSFAVRQPFRELLRTNLVHVAIGCAILAGTGTFNGLFFSHLPAYLTAVLKYDAREAVSAQTVGVIASAIGILITGWVGDRIPPRYLLRTGVGLLLVFAIPWYAALQSRAVDLTVLCVLAGVTAGLTNGSFAVLLTDLFPTRIRFTGVALVFNVSFTIFSGTAPLVATTLIRDTASPTSPAYLMMFSAALALIGSLWVERFGGNVMKR